MDDLSYQDLPLYSHRVALFIGINNYIHYASLNYAVSDAEKVAKVLQDFGNFSVRLLTDHTVGTQKVTLTQIEDAINWLFEQASSKNTLLLLYFSGHAAVTPNGQLYLMPGDARIEKEKTEHFAAFRFDELRSLIEATRAGAFIVVLDTCYSGASTFLPRGVLTPKNFSLHMIGASQRDQEAKESEPARHSAFTYYLLNAFQQQSSRNDQWINSDEVETYVREGLSQSRWTQRVWRLTAGEAIPLVRVGYQGESIYEPVLPGQATLSGTRPFYPQSFFPSGYQNQIFNTSPQTQTVPAQIITTTTSSPLDSQNYYIPSRSAKNHNQIVTSFIISIVFFLLLIILFASVFSVEKDQSLNPTATTTAFPNLTPLTASTFVAQDTSSFSSSAAEVSLVQVPMEAVVKLPTTSRIYATAFIPHTANKFVAISEDGTVSKWSIEIGADDQSNTVKLENSIHLTEANNSKIMVLSKALSVSSDGKTVAVAKTNGFRLINLENALELLGSSNLKDEHRARVEGLAFSPDNKHLVTVSSDRAIKVWDVTNLKNPTLLKSMGDEAFYSVAFIDNITIATGDGDGKIRIWDINNAKDVSPIPNGIPVHKGSWAYWLAFAPGQYGANRLVASISGYTKDTTPSASQTPEIKLILIPSNNGNEALQATTVITQSLISQTLIREQVQNEWMYSTAFSSTGKYLAVAYGNGSIKIWNTVKLTIANDMSANLDTVGERVTAIAFSNDDKFLVAGNDIGTIFVWKVSAKL